MEVNHPEWLQIQADNKTLYGYSQEWYKTSFQRTRGCGPTAAAMLLLYLNRRVTESLPYQGHSIPDITKVLEDVWNFVTPGWLLGLNSTNKFCKGTEALLRHYKLAWQCQVLSIPMFRSSRPSLMTLIKFLEEGMASDCPIAFLNLHKGQETALESWHWIVLISLLFDEEQKRYIATCYDGGRLVTFDVGIWLETSSFGGGFVYITV